jgi:DNA polymerase-1
MTTRLLARDAETLSTLGNRLTQSRRWGFDSESSGPLLVNKSKNSEFVNMYRASLTGCSFHFPDDDISYYVPIGHSTGNASPVAIRSLLASAWPGQISCHNASHEILALRGHKDLEPLTLVDTAVLMWLLNYWAEDGGYGLKELVKSLYGHQMLTFKEVTEGRQFSELDPSHPRVIQYACEDAEWSYALSRDYLPEIDNYVRMKDTFWNVEMPFVRVLRHIQDTGMVLDEGRVVEVHKKLTDMKLPIEREWDFISDGMNLNSSKQLQWFYENKHWPTEGVEWKRKSKRWGTSAEFMELLAESPKATETGRLAARLRLDYMEVGKLLSTYTTSILENAQQYPDGRLHSSLLHWGTATGRLSSSYPNLQNIPTRTDLGKLILACFTAPEGSVLVNADYSQIELRVLAHLCGRGRLLEAYQRGTDVHQETADLLKISRFQGKTLNFAVVYGAMEQKLSGMLGVTVPEARDILDRFWQGMPEIADLKKKAVEFTRKHGYIRTYLGRIRRLPDIDSGNKWLRLKEERRAGNTPIQGGARDLMTMAMVNIYSRLKRENLLSDIQMCGQVHDDNLLYATHEAKEVAKRILKEEMETVATLRVPLIAEPGEGACWKDLKG